MINEIQEEQKDRDKTVRNMPMVERELSQEQMDEINRINGLSEKEKRELTGVINPWETIDKSTRPD